jgi:uncharacterized protein YjbJ (UPF0337 family)
LNHHFLFVFLMAIHRHITHCKGLNMNWDQIEGNWKQLKGNVKQQWGKLTDDQLDIIAGKREQLAGKIQEIYGTAKDEVEKELTEWQATQKDAACCSKETKSH